MYFRYASSTAADSLSEAVKTDLTVNWKDKGGGRCKSRNNPRALHSKLISTECPSGKRKSRNSNAGLLCASTGTDSGRKNLRWGVRREQGDSGENQGKRREGLASNSG